jgi:hypothetical protein
MASRGAGRVQRSGAAPSKDLKEDRMHFSFIGHNAMYFGGPGGLLMDPLLFDKYGDDYTSSPVEVYPPRSVDIPAMPTPSGIVISHEHSDHFHVPSLNAIDRSAVIYVGPLMPQPVVELAAGLGFTVERVPFGEQVRCGDVVFQLFPAGDDTLLWESRVSQVYIRDAADLDAGGVFVTIDALPSFDFINAVETGTLPRPTTLACSNNAQVTPSGVYGATDNLTADGAFVGAAQKQPFAGVDILHSVFVDTCSDTDIFQDCGLIITGGGFLKDYEEMGPFPFADQHLLAESLRDLTGGGIDILAPLPGDATVIAGGRFTDAGTTSWVTLNSSRYDALTRRRDGFIAANGTIGMKAVTSAISVEEIPAALRMVTKDLEYLAQILMMTERSSQLCALAAELGRYDDLILFTLVDDGTEYHWAFDLRQSRFVTVAPSLSTLTARRAHYPFGIVAHLSDWVAVLTGELQIWDIVGVAMRCWYPDDPAISSIVYTLYNAYGEQAKPQAAYQVYRNQLATIVERPVHHG